MKKKRDLLTLEDVSLEELKGLIAQAGRFKRHRRLGSSLLRGQVVGLIFQKPSTRTRVAFEVAVMQLGGSTLYLGQEDIQLGKREPTKDVARVLSRYVDAVVFRTFSHETMKEFAAFSSVPVINGLSDTAHPCQALADVFTIQEQFGKLKGLKLAYVGDANNVLCSLINACSRLGVDVAIATPGGYRPEKKFWSAAQQSAKAHGSKLSWSKDPHQAVKGAAVIYTDVWVSMGSEREGGKRRRAFKTFQVNEGLLKKAASHCRVMHCLPAHRGEEITDSVMEGRHSIVFDQAENRLHAHKALLALLLGKKR